MERHIVADLLDAAAANERLRERLGNEKDVACCPVVRKPIELGR